MNLNLKILERTVADQELFLQNVLPNVVILITEEKETRINKFALSVKYVITDIKTGQEKIKLFYY